MKCACDACVVVFRRGDARSEDGLCDLCATRCYPMVDIAGELQRVVIAPEGRAGIHAEAAGLAPGAPSRRDRRMAAREAQTAARVEMARQALRVVVPVIGPVVAPHARRAAERLLRKIFGT